MPSASLPTVVILEDDEAIAGLLRLHLAEAGCSVIHLSDGSSGLDYLLSHPFDLLILDLNLPGKDGLSICSELRRQGMDNPVLMLTARSGEEEKVLGFETGADDYLTKPFGIRELLARVKALLRRSERDRMLNVPELTVRRGDIEIDPARRRVEVRGNRVELTPKEYDLLWLLASHPGVTFDRKTLLSKVWSSDYEGYEHTVNSHINRLRSKIEVDPNHPEYVLTTWGVGYRFTDEP